MLYDIFYKSLAILISFNFFILAYFLKRLVGTNYHPAVIFSFSWGLFTLIPMVLIYPAPINPFAILYILMCAISFAAATFIDSNRIAYVKFSSNSIARRKFLISLRSRFLVGMLFVSSILGVVLCFWIMLINGWSLNDIFFDLLATSGRFAALRGNEGMEYGFIGSIGVIFIYLSASLGGLIYSSIELKLPRFLVALMALVPSIMAMVIQSSKLIFLIAFSFFIGGIFLINIYNLKPLRFNIKTISMLAKIFMMLVPFVLISFISREHYLDLDDMYRTLELLRYAMTSYALGQIFAFSDFFSFYIGMDSVSRYNPDYFRMGAYTFSSIADIFGANINFPPGLYLETGWYSDIFETNIFTIFRGVILDFGIVGSFVAFAIMGLIANIVFSGILKAKNNHLSNIAYIHIVVFVFMSYLVSVFMARYMYANFILLAAIFVVNGALVKSNLSGSKLIGVRLVKPHA